MRKALLNATIVLPAFIALAIAAANIYVFHAPLKLPGLLLVGASVLYLALCFILRETPGYVGRVVFIAWAVVLVGGLYSPLKMYLSGEAKADPVWASAFDKIPWGQDFVQEHRASNRLWWRSYVYFRRPPFKGKYINVNSDGVRNSWNAPHGDTKPIRVFTFGGSTMWGSGARDEYTIPSDLSRILSQQGFNVEFTNNGETGWVSTQSLIWLILQLRQGNVPDVVMFYDGANDTHSSFQNREPGMPGNEINRKKQFQAERSMFNGKVPKIDDTSLANLAIDRYLGNLEILDALAKTYGFSVLAVWQPISYVDKELTDYEKGQGAALGKPLAEYFRLMYGIMRERAPKNVLNVSDVFAGVKDEVYLDFAHLNELGDEIVAKRIAPALAQVLRNRGAKPAQQQLSQVAAPAAAPAAAP
jgi:lysophospholipase L1-like esterase